MSKYRELIEYKKHLNNFVRLPIAEVHTKFNLLDRINLFINDYNRKHKPINENIQTLFTNVIAKSPYGNGFQFRKIIKMNPNEAVIYVNSVLDNIDKIESKQFDGVDNGNTYYSRYILYTKMVKQRNKLTENFANEFRTIIGKIASENREQFRNLSYFDVLDFDVFNDNISFHVFGENYQHSSIYNISLVDGKLIYDVNIGRKDKSDNNINFLRFVSEAASIISLYLSDERLINAMKIWQQKIKKNQVYEVMCYSTLIYAIEFLHSFEKDIHVSVNAPFHITRTAVIKPLSSSIRELSREVNGIEYSTTKLVYRNGKKLSNESALFLWNHGYTLNELNQFQK